MHSASVYGIRCRWVRTVNASCCIAALVAPRVLKSWLIFVLAFALPVDFGRKSKFPVRTWVMRRILAFALEPRTMICSCDAESPTDIVASGSCSPCPCCLLFSRWSAKLRGANKTRPRSWNSQRRCTEWWWTEVQLHCLPQRLRKRNPSKKNPFLPYFHVKCIVFSFMSHSWRR